METSILTAPPPSPAPAAFSTGSLCAALLLVALAVAALLLARRRRASPRLVRIVESASLGPKRSLVVARVGDELLLLGSSEGGIALLSRQPAPPEPAEVAAPATPAGTPAGPKSRFELLLGANAPGRHAQRTPETAADESAEDVELRRKLAAGQAARIR